MPDARCLGLRYGLAPAPQLRIDLGLARGEPDEYARPGRSTLPGWFAPVIIMVIVLLSSAASAAPPPPALAPVLTLRIEPADPYTLTAGGDLLAQTYGQLSAYDLDDGRLRWQAGSASPSYVNRRAIQRRPYRVKAALRLFSDGPATGPWVLFTRDVHSRGGAAPAKVSNPASKKTVLLTIAGAVVAAAAVVALTARASRGRLPAGLRS
jgi:hypothetical protein